MNPKPPISFLRKLFDWKGFELFVADLYINDSEVTVEHNVTEIGKSGAKRQIDVLVYQKTNFHNLKIIVECKLWKEKVDRPVIDVLYAAIEDLNANKGVIFTTIGYEEGATQYAQSKNIDIFLIREVQDDEWGKPGRNVFFYMQMFSAMFEKFTFKYDNNYISLDGYPPFKKSLEIKTAFTPDQKYDEDLQLFSYPALDKGPNLLKLIIDVRNFVLKNLCEGFQGVGYPLEEKHDSYFRVPVNMLFQDYPYSFVSMGNGYLKLTSIAFELLHNVSQTKHEFDRAGYSDFVLIVEDYITHQKHFVSKQNEEEKIKMQKVVGQPTTDQQPLTNGALMKFTTEHWVSFPLSPEIPIQTLKEINVNLVTNNI